MWKRQASAAHGPRRDSGQETPTQRPRGELFPTLSSHLAPLLVRSSPTLQPWAPPLDPTMPCRSQTSPASSSSRAEPPPPQPRSQPSGLGGHGALLLKDGSRLESPGALLTLLGPRLHPIIWGKSLIRKHKTCICLIHLM